MRSGRSWRPGFLVALLLAAFWAMAVSVSPRMGITADEPGHLTAGYSYWRYNDYRLNPENGTLAMRIAALPLLPMGLAFPSLEGEAWQRSSAVGVADEFFFALGNPVEAMLWRARAAIAMVGVFALWLVWCWARGLFGPAAGWLALGVAMFCPTMLAHGGLATSDMTVAACFLAALSCVWRLLHRATWSRLLLAGLACGAAFTAKMSGAILVPLFAVLLVLRWWRGGALVVALGRVRWLRRRPAIVVGSAGLVVATAALSLAVLWASYGFRYEGFNRAVSAAHGYFFPWEVVLERAPVPWSQDSALAEFVTPHRAPAPSRLTETITWLRDRRVLPEAFLWGLAHTMKFAQERPGFFRGEFSKTGWRAFFPTAFLMKTPAPALVVFVAGLAALLFARRERRADAIARCRPWLYRAAPLLIFAAVYGAMAINSRLNIGHRHILPLYPVFYILGSAAVLWLNGRHRRAAFMALAALVAWHAVESWRARPFYLSYFQPVFGGPAQAYRTFVDSSLDWGQGLPDLARWDAARREAGDTAPLHLSYAGVDLPRRHGIAAVRFGDAAYDLGPRGFPAQVGAGWFAISATQFQRIYLPVRGPWTARHEALYREIAARLVAAATGAAPLDRERHVRDARDYELLQFGRLCHFLAGREPDGFVGGSILLFRLSGAEVNAALHAPLGAFTRDAAASAPAR